MISRFLRGIAVAIAVAAAIDPPVTMTARGRPRIALVLQDSELDAARSAHGRLVDSLRAEFDVVSGPDGAADAVVVVGTGYPDQPPPEGQRAFTVTLAATGRESNIRVSSLRTPRDVPPGTLIHLEVDVEGSHVAGATSTLIVRTGHAETEVARATHAWTASPERWRAALDVTPLGLPPWRLHVEVSGAPGERVLVDNAADAMVASAEPLRVLVYEPRLSWAGTFVRRALEHDSRFDVAGVAYPSRGVRVTAVAGEPRSEENQVGTSAGLGRTVTNRTRAVIVGGLDRVTAEDAGVLSRFMRERGGSVVLLPDSRADAQTVARWLPIPAVAEVLLEQRARLSVEPPLPSIEVSELLTFETAPAMRALARNGASAPVIAVAPVGAGHLVVSGALDAWRFRANDRGAFDRFWQSAIAGLAGAAPPAIDVQVTPPIVAPGEKADVHVQVRRAAIGLAPDDDLRVSAVVSAGDAVRLWPGDAPDTFHGSFVAPAGAGASRVTVTAAERATGIAGFVVAPHARSARPEGPALSLLADSRGGADIAPGDIPKLTRRLRQEMTAPAVRVERRPMRSPWWFVPFAAGLGGEWWLRRRRGLR